MNQQRNNNDIDKSKSTHRSGHYRPISRVNPAYADKLNNNSKSSSLTTETSTAPSKASLAVSATKSNTKSNINTKHTQKTKTWPKILVVLNVLLIMSLMAGVVFLYTKYAESQAMVSKLSTAEGQQEFNKKELYEILADMRRLVELPSDEEPSITTIIDASKVKNVEFYSNAQNGDKLVEYNSAKIRYIYRPSKKTIINVGSFEPEPSKQQ